MEVFAEYLEDCAFDNEHIVHGLRTTDALRAVPAGLTTAGDAGVHDIVTDEHVGLELLCRTIYQDAPRQEVEGHEETNPFDGPAEDGCLGVFRLCKLAALENSDRVDDTQTPVKFSTGNVVVNALSRRQSGRQRKTIICIGTHASIILNGFLGHVVFAEVGQEVITDD